MRRFWSISTVLALTASLFAPMSTASMMAGHPLGCPRMAVHRAEDHKAHAMMHGHHCSMPEMQESLPASTDGDGISSRAEGCPMDCCVQRSLPNSTAIASFSLIPPLAVTEAEIQFVPVTFTSTGFSSHTDRGPPAA